jgi:hypothetical protein
MERTIAIILFAMAGFFSVGAQAAPITIDFESEAPGTPAPLTIDGFTFVNGEVTDFSGDKKFFSSASGICNVFQCGPLIIGLTRDDGGAFAFFGADVLTDSASGLEMYAVEGIKVGGGFAEGPIGSSDWLNLTHVRFEVASFCSGSECGPSGQIDYDTLTIYIDNVSVQAVPIPAAAWLFGSALAGLGWMRRKQTV